MGFIRARASKGPRHEFDAPEVVVAARPEVYVVLDPVPVPEPRPVKYVVTGVQRTSRRQKKRAARAE